MYDDLRQRLNDLAEAIAQNQPQALAIAQTLPGLLQTILASATPSWLAEAQPLHTEMHRLVQLLQHHMLLWQAAKQKREARSQQVLHDIEQLRQFCQHLSQTLK